MVGALPTEFGLNPACERASWRQGLARVRTPDGIDPRAVEAELGARVEGVEGAAILENLAPLLIELILELVGRDVEVGRLEDGRLGGDRIVVLRERTQRRRS